MSLCFLPLICSFPSKTLQISLVNKAAAKETCHHSEWTLLNLKTQMGLPALAAGSLAETGSLVTGAAAFGRQREALDFGRADWALLDCLCGLLWRLWLWRMRPLLWMVAMKIDA